MDYASIGSVVVAVVALIVSIANTQKKEARDNGTQIAEVLAKLNSLSDDMRELKSDMAELRQSMQNDHDRIIKLEMSLDTAWKRIDELRGVSEREVR